MSFKVGSDIAITNAKVVQGNQSGRAGEFTQTQSSGNLLTTLDLSTGNMFDFNPNYTGVTGDVRFDFNSIPIQHHEFYLFWHDYKDSCNTSNTFNLNQTVHFAGQVDTLNNSNSGLQEAATQVFKFTTTTGNGTPIWYGTLYVRNIH